MRIVTLVSTLLLLALQAQAQTAPRVLHSPDAAFEAGDPGTYSLELVLVTGQAFTPEVSAQEICKNGVGDESCGTYVVATTDGDTAINSFSSVGSEVSWNRLSSTELRIVKLATSGTPRPGDWGHVPLGQISVTRTSSGTLNLDAESSYVRADLEMMSMVADTEPLPEPSEWLMLGSLLGTLGLLHRLRPERGGDCL